MSNPTCDGAIPSVQTTRQASQSGHVGPVRPAWREGASPSCSLHLIRWKKLQTPINLAEDTTEGVVEDDIIFTKDY